MWKEFLKRFWDDTRGNIAILSAVALPAALITVGAAVDMSRMHSTSRFLQDATDNAALAALSDYDLSKSGQRKLGQESLSESYRYMESDVEILQQKVKITDSGQTATVDVSARVPLYFSSFLDKDNGKVSLTSVATRSGQPNIVPTSLMFVLDASGSMNQRMGSRSRLSVLQTTIRDLFDGYDDDYATKERVRTGVYSYNWGIRDEYSNALENGWDGVVNNVNFMKLGNATIPTQALEVAVNDLVAETSVFNGESRRKVIVFMTDGEVDDHLNMDGKSSEYHPYTGYSGSFTQRTIDACAKAQASGISIIAVSMGAPEEGRKLLKDCVAAGTDDGTIFVDATNAQTFEDALALSIPTVEESYIRLAK